MKQKDLKKWRGILKINEFVIYKDESKEEIIYKEENIHNILHQQGELLILNTLFLGDPAPSSYYVGLDNRANLNFTDTLLSLVDEPSGNGYARQQILPAQFVLSLTSGSNYQISGPIINFTASTGSWGPVQNLFLTNVAVGTGGTLISSVRLSQSLTLSPPNIASLKFSFALANC